MRFTIARRFHPPRGCGWPRPRCGVGECNWPRLAGILDQVEEAGSAAQLSADTVMITFQFRRISNGDANLASGREPQSNACQFVPMKWVPFRLIPYPATIAGRQKSAAGGARIRHLELDESPQRIVFLSPADGCRNWPAIWPGIRRLSVA